MATPVHELTSVPETLEHHANVLKKSANRRVVFKAIYTRKTDPKSVGWLMKHTGFDRKQVLAAGKELADNGLVTQTKSNSETAYSKTNFCKAAGRRDKILSLAENPDKIEKLVTVRRPKPSTTTIVVEFPAETVRASLITVDDIDSFSKVKDVKVSEDRLPKTLSEDDFKKGIQKIIGEASQFKDWGGEHSDLMTTRVRYQGQRIRAAFAFKGPGTSGKLVPARMGKNGDQCQRLFTEAADLFVVQHWREIDPSVVTLAETFAKVKSVSEMREIKFCIIDGQDSLRIFKAYPSAFT